MHAIVESIEHFNTTEHVLDNGGKVIIYHDDGSVWLYPQARHFISVDDALAFVA